jgi:type IV fimbrial biogenesis protein FimT
MTKQHAPAQQQLGITLIESMSVLTILSLIVGSALPSFASLRQRADLVGVAAQVETDVQFARSQAAAFGSTVRMSLHEAQAGTCYIVHTGPSANCSCDAAGLSPAACSGESQLLRSVSLSAKGDVQVRSASRSIAFDPVKGTVTPTATMRIEARDGRAIHQVVNLLGRVRSCSPGGKTVGEQAC